MNNSEVARKKNFLTLKESLILSYPPAAILHTRMHASITAHNVLVILVFL